MLTFNSTLVKSPKEFSVSIKGFYRKAKRNNNAGAVRDFVAVKRILKVEWPIMSQTDLSAILTIINEDSFSITYPDPELGEVTKDFFVSDKEVIKSPIVRSEAMWEGLSVTFEER